MSEIAEELAGLGLADALVRLSHLVQNVFADACREHDLTPQQAQLLCLLVDGPLGMAALTRLLHLGKSGLTGLVDRAERRGLVSRVADPDDRRGCQVALTGDGSQLAVATHRAVTARLDKLTEALSENTQPRLLAAIGQVLQADESINHRSWTRPRQTR